MYIIDEEAKKIQKFKNNYIRLSSYNETAKFVLYIMVSLLILFILIKSIIRTIKENKSKNNVETKENNNKEEISKNLKYALTIY